MPPPPAAHRLVARRLAADRARAQDGRRAEAGSAEAGVDVGSPSPSAGVDGDSASPSCVSVLPRVLSIQSHVVSGYVGCKASTLPLQLLGFHVDGVHTVQFSNHTGYPSFRGRVLTGEELEALVEGMAANGLLSGITHVLTGFLGSESLAASVERVLELVRCASEASEPVRHVLDPVMGDQGRLYVSPALPPVFRRLTRRAHLIAPNQFEAELLAGRKIASLADADRVCALLHGLEGDIDGGGGGEERQGPSIVVITSMQLDDPPEGSGRPEGDARVGTAGLGLAEEPHSGTIPSAIPSSIPSATTSADSPATSSPASSSAAPCSSSADRRSPALKDIWVFASAIEASPPSTPSSSPPPPPFRRRFVARVPQLEGYFTGTGDLFTALLLAWTHKEPARLDLALSRSLSTLQAVVADTARAAASALPPGAGAAERRDAATCRARELRVVENVPVILEPGERVRVAEWTPAER